MFAHCAPENITIGHVFNSNEQFCHSIWNHWHLSGIVNDTNGQRVFYDITEFLDRSQAKIYDVTANAFIPYWTSTQRDLDGNLLNSNLPITDTPMVKAIFKLTALNTATFNIRLEPTSQSQDIGDIPPGMIWQSNVYAEGENIQGHTKWWQIIVPAGQANAGIVGYASEAWIKAEAVLPGDPTCQINLTAANDTIAKLNSKINNSLVSAKNTVTLLS